MENNIKIYDDFLTSTELATCVEYLSKPRWSFGNMTNSENTIFNIPLWLMELKKIPFFSVIIKKKIENLTNKKFMLKNVYAGGQTYGQESIYHLDSDDEQCYTFCLYMTSLPDSQIQDGGGNIQFKLTDTNFIIGIEPCYNRAVYFPSNYLHKGTSYNRFISDLRICVTWKLILINS